MKRKIVGAVLLAVLFAEVVLRIQGEVLPLSRLQSLSMEYVPAVYAHSVFPRKARKAGPGGLYEINSHGYRGKEFSWKKSKTRILVYGGSTVFGLGLSGDQTWPARLEQQLGSGVEVINVGVSGARSQDMLGHYLTEGHLLDPDLVIISFGWNDLKYFHREEPLLRSRRPYAPADNHFLYPLNSLDGFLAENLRIYLPIRNRWLLHKHREVLKAVNKRYPLHVYRWPEEVFSETPGSVAVEKPEARTQLEFTIRAFRGVLEGRKAVFLLEPTLLSASNSPEEVERSWSNLPLRRERIIEVYHRVGKELPLWVKGTNSVAWDSSGMWGQSDYFVDFVHTTPQGAEELARRIAPIVKKQLK